MSDKISMLRLLAVCLLMLATMGCVSLSREYPEKREYLLEVERTGESASTPVDATLAVRPFRVSPGFDQKQLVVRLDDGVYTSDFYNIFFAPPGRHLAQVTEEWLSASGIFTRVSPASSMEPIDFLVEGNIVRLYGDYSGSGEAVVEMQLALVSVGSGEPETLLHRTYRSSQPLADEKPDELVAGMTAACTEILSAFEADLVACLNERSR